MARITLKEIQHRFIRAYNDIRGKNEPKSLYYGNTYVSSQYSNMIGFDGEKTPYNLGAPYELYIDYYSMRKRSWSAYISTDLIQNAIRKYMLWIVGSGLKLDYTPEIEIENRETLIESVEKPFRLWAKSNYATYSGEFNLHVQATEALKNALLAGDILVICRIEKGRLNVQLIDGCYVLTPPDMSYVTAAVSRGNRIESGIEIDAKGSHVAYYVVTSEFKYERIPAYGENSKKRMCWMMYGMRGKINDVRGMSLLTAVLENVAKLDRYKEASVGAAEEGAKFIGTIEHNQFSDGENPLIEELKQSMGKDKGGAPETYQTDCNIAATKIAQTTEKTVLNMPIGSSFKKMPTNVDINFSDFYSPNADIVFATVGIPPNVATDKYDDSYSASRAALKSWEYKMYVDRTITVQDQFYRPIFELWLDVNSLAGKVKIPGYNEALRINNIETLLMLRSSRFIGATVPHIDPVKEVTAERLKLGDSFANVPLTSLDQACENLNTGDYNSIKERMTIEYNNLPDDFKVKEVTAPIAVSNSGAE